MLCRFYVPASLVRFGLRSHVDTMASNARHTLCWLGSGKGHTTTGTANERRDLRWATLVLLAACTVTSVIVLLASLSEGKRKTESAER